jgi:quercetin dioxygenase-like cupin family protein
MPFVSLDDLDPTEKIPGYFGRFVHGDTMTMARWEVEAGRSFPEHSHPHEQISIVVEGTFELTIDGETDVLEPGRVAVIPGGAVHSGTARTDCEIIDIFNPVREAYT